VAWRYADRTFGSRESRRIERETSVSLPFLLAEAEPQTAPDVTREPKRNWLNKRVNPRLNSHSRTRFARVRPASGISELRRADVHDVP